MSKKSSIKTLPRISIITPTFNQGHFIEQTICSVLDQNYPNLEYIVIDGGSTDNTLEVIKKYESHIHYWVSEKDKGQSDAINKGLKVAGGDIINWLNSDDYYMPGALQHVAEVFADPNIIAYCGKSRVFSNVTEKLSQGTDLYTSLPKTIGWARIDQPETFLCKKAWDKLYRVNEAFHYVMDKELWIRYLLYFGLSGIFKDDVQLVNFRIHEQSKTGSQLSNFKKEALELYYSIAMHAQHNVAVKLATLNTVTQKNLFGYDGIDHILLGKSINYFILLTALEAYAENDYQLAKKAAGVIDTSLLDDGDLHKLNTILFRMKIIPVGIKKIINSISR